MKVVDDCGTCNICDYSGYDKCPKKQPVKQFVATGDYAEEIQQLHDAWLLNNKRKGRMYRSLKGKQR